MSALFAYIRREPAATAGLVSAVIALLVALGVSVPAGAVMGVVAALSAFVVRSQVTPVVSLPAVTVNPGLPQVEAKP